MQRELVMKARKFAEDAHRGQERNFGGGPYFGHLCEVATIVDSRGLSEDAAAVAYLHDTIEDTATTADMIAHEFGGRIAVHVIELTNYSKFFGNRDQRHRLNCSRLARASSIAKSVKCADLISNTASIVKHNPNFAVKYLREKEDVLLSIQNGYYEVADSSLLEMAWECLRHAKCEMEIKNGNR